MKGLIARISGWKIALISGVLFGGMLSNAGLAAELPGGKAFFAAADQFERLAEASKGKDTLPRRRDPEVRRVLDTLTDASAVFGTVQYGKDDLLTVQEVCERANRSVKVYVNFAMAKAATGTTQAQKIQLVRDAIADYQDEIMPFLAFAAVCTAKSVKPTIDFLNSLKPEEVNDARQAGVRGVRDSIAQMLQGALITYADRSISFENRKFLLQVVTEQAGQLIPATTLQQRQMLSQLVAGILKNEVGDSGWDLVTISQKLSSTDCTGLCALHN